ncbi:hypothetical protein TRICI_002569 [Trichomonascus ciferrii]|uniref:EH domain-containing protein n=1 Tax=Trichomonascus ciferrii TaxID=44093 RepID=A0A642VBU9_9ASCO|nr:hypothetical protein TRICI_002569 [Trichomonascus ciferrii]
MSSSSGGSHLRQTAPNRTGANRYEAFRRQRADELAAAKNKLLQKKTNIMTAAAQSAAVSTKRDPLIGENKNAVSSPVPPQSSSSSTSAASAAFKRPHHPTTSSTDQLLSKGSGIMGTAAAAAGATRTMNYQTVRKTSDPTLSIAALAGASSANSSLAQNEKPVSSDAQSIRSIESIDEPKNALRAAQVSVTHLEEPKSVKKQESDVSRKGAIKAAQQSVVTKPTLQLNTEVSASGPEIVSPVPKRISLPGFVLDGIDDDRRPMTVAHSRRDLTPPSRASTGEADLLRPVSAVEPRVASAGSRPALKLRRSLDDRPEVKAALKAGLETISPDPMKPPKRSRAEASWPRFLFQRTKSAGAGDSSGSSGNNHSGSAVHPVIRTTMRKEGKKSRFNEDKPWKHNLHTGRVEEAERKRYEGLWATNKGIHCRYLTHIEETDDEENNVHGLVVRELWRRSRLPEDILEKIWNLVDRRRIGSLDREEFLVGMWLVDQCLYGRKLPPRVDDKVWSSVSRLNVKINIRKHMHKHIHKHNRKHR